MTASGIVDDAEIDRIIADRPTRAEKWGPGVLWRIATWFALCAVALYHVPNPIFDPQLLTVTFTMGALGVWRYSWWFNHAVRAEIYARRAYPAMAAEAAGAWEGGWRPRHLHFMMTTYREHEEITARVVRSILREVREVGRPATIWLGSSVRFDEDVVLGVLEREVGALDVTLRILRQDVPGKRAAIATALRAMSRGGVDAADPVVFMDGDFALEPGAMRRCLPLFATQPDLHALTTDEEVIVIGPRWMGAWLRMRFAQRRLAMQSHSLSGRVLTLTGRMSCFRAHHLLTRDFIRTLEADHLDHWLWGRFRFLSGDDKSTWYTLLGRGCRMLYVPDALGYTIEVVDGSGVDRMVQNFRRWSGNMLRNGARAIALGPRRMPFFIWWCLVDQRLAIWTMLFSPMLALMAAVLDGWAVVAAYLVFLAVTRMALALVLYRHARRVELSWPIILYANQLLNASVKVYSIWRLSKQRWANRGGQTGGSTGERWLTRARGAIAIWGTTVSVALLMLCAILYAGLVPLPRAETVRFALGL